MSNRNQLPPDPENMNGDRAEWAGAALRHFQCVTGTDYEDALGDLLGISCTGATATTSTSNWRSSGRAVTTRPKRPGVSHEQKNLQGRVFHGCRLCLPRLRSRDAGRSLAARSAILRRQSRRARLRSYDTIEPLDQVQIWDAHKGTLATWESEDFRLRRGAPKLLAALRLCVRRLEDYQDAEGGIALEGARSAIAMAEPPPT
jgi:hypothetical protein